MPLYLNSLGTVANGTAYTGPYIPPTQQLSMGDPPYTLFTVLDEVPGQASIAVFLGKKDEGHAGSVSIEGFFDGAPGVFEIDFQTSDVDADGLYQQEGLAINALGSVAANSFRAEFLNVSANFARVFVKTLTNDVDVTLKISYR